MLNFEDLNLIPPLMLAVKSEGYTEPTPIQEQAIPHVLAGQDLLGCAQTGTGKTAAFALPILQMLSEHPVEYYKRARPIRALVLTPTRELAAQIGDSFAVYGKNTKLNHAVIFGGVNQRPQTAALERGVDILVATPGRLLDLVWQGFIDFGSLDVFVLDEADRMLDMGFIKDVRRIVEMLPERRQTLFFSATMPPEIRILADDILYDPISVAVAPPCSTVELTDQSVYFVEKLDKPDLLAHLFKDPALKRVLIFTRTKHGADKVARHLERCRISSDAIHGNKTQNARTRALELFKKGRIRALVATDIASRGIDVEDVTHVINYDLSNEPENYVHRIGRTGRAGAVGSAISFCDSSERPFLNDIERLIKKRIRHVSDHPFKSRLSAPPETDLKPRPKPGIKFSSNHAAAPSTAGGYCGGYAGRQSAPPRNRGMRSH